MDQFQATSSADVIDARRRSAIRFADVLLLQAVRSLVEIGGSKAAEDFRRNALRAIEQAEQKGEMEEPLQSFAVEEVERALQYAMGGSVKVPGWSFGEPVTIEERKRQPETESP